MYPSEEKQNWTPDLRKGSGAPVNQSPFDQVLLTAPCFTHSLSLWTSNFLGRPLKCGKQKVWTFVGQSAHEVSLPSGSFERLLAYWKGSAV